MLRQGAEAWVLINIPDLAPRAMPILSQLDEENICILGGYAGMGGYANFKDGVILSAKTGQVVRLIDPASEITFKHSGQSYELTSG